MSTTKQSRPELVDAGKLGPASPSPIKWVLPAVTASIALPVYNQGTLVLLDVLLLLIAPVLVVVVWRETFLRNIWLVAALWSIAQMVSDLVNDGELLSGLTFTGPAVALLCTGLFWVHKNLRISGPHVLVMAGMGWLGLELVVGQAMASTNPWKYGLASPTAVALLSLAYALKAPRKVVIYLLLALALTSLFFDSRFQTGLFLACVIAVALFGNKKKTRKPGLAHQLLAVAVGLGMFAIYPSVAMSGALGQRAYQQQSVYDSEGANFLLATRLELPHTFFLAIQDPLLGIGSYGQVKAESAYAALQFVQQNIAPLSMNTTNYLLGASEGFKGYYGHTSVMASFLFAGVLSLPFWLFIFYQTLKALRRLFAGGTTAPAVLAYLSGLTLWDALFSPITARSHVGIAIAMFVVGLAVAGAGKRAGRKPKTCASIGRSRLLRSTTSLKNSTALAVHQNGALKEKLISARDPDDRVLHSAYRAKPLLQNQFRE